MKKIVIGGAGAYHFAPAILEDLLVRWHMPCELWLVDADLDMAELTARAAKALAGDFGSQVRFFYTTRMEKAVPGADAVIIAADFLDADAWQMDYEALDEVGLGKQVRLNGGLGGLMQTLRASGFIADVAEQMKKTCPEDALLVLCDSGFGGLQLSRACEAAGRVIGVRTLGVSAAAEQTKKRLSLYLGVPEEKMELTCAGLNGFAWVTEMKRADTGENLIPRCMKEMAEDPREALSAQYIDWYGAIPAGDRVMQYELLADTEKSPRRTVIYSGVGAADYELRKRNLAHLAVHGLLHPDGLAAWKQIRESGFASARPVEILRALWGMGACSVQSLTMPCDGALPGITPGRCTEGPAHVDGEGAHGIRTELPVELQDVIEQISLCNLLYAEAAATGNRDALRQGLEIDPALTGVDLLYAEGVLEQMMERQQDRLPRFNRED